ncbi:type VI secretion system baseplate subunit TssF [Larkinella sp. VNQ87]|uniref:type VI secretion system baseplate subunit TssF n=1 Tax=Larkinella sp. VNQ87 TaxID=3400921 RepID=UPI003C0E77CE
MITANRVTDTFARERVKNRMLRRAAELWGYTETDLDSFDPLVALLIEACAVEFERIGVEIGNTQTRLLDRLAQVLHPEPAVARPAFGIAQVRPVEPRASVSPTTQLAYKRTARAETGGSTTNQEIYFSPVGTYPVLDGAVRYIATSETLFGVDENNQKIPLAQRQHAPAIRAHQSLWLGLELDENVPSLTGISFFFDWPTEADRLTCQPLLALSPWQLGSHTLSVQTGLATNDGSSVPLPEQAFNPMHKLEKLAERACDRHFVTIQSAPDFQSVGVQRQPYPTVFGQLFAERDLRTLREPLWWIELQLPHTIGSSALAGVFCGLNGFPVINRRLNRLTYRLQPNLNIIPLETDRCFLAVREVRNSQNRPLTAIPFSNPSELETDTYTVQYGLGRFDDRDARQVLVNLMELLRDESAAFSALGEDFLASAIRELNQALARLEAKVDQKMPKRDAVPYLVIKPKRPGETVFIEYWTCDGETVNRLPVGSRLNPYNDTTLRRDAGFLVSSTLGGRERPGESEKIMHYKQALLTRNRVVTPEDVRTVCRTELGTHLQQVTVERTFRVSTDSTSGFERCLRVRLVPSATSSYTPADWEQQTRLLQLRLEDQSVASLPYQLVVSPA